MNSNPSKKKKRCKVLTKKNTSCTKTVNKANGDFCVQHEQSIIVNHEIPIALSNVLYEQLRVIHDVFTLHRILYWADYGTLLGAIRHGGLIPWDDDGDIAVPLEYKSKVIDLKTEFQELGYCLNVDAEYHFQLSNVWLPGKEEISPGVDIIFYKQRSKTKTYECCIEDEEMILYNDPLPLRSVSFGNFNICVPNEDECIRWLTKCYDQWETTLVVLPLHIGSKRKTKKVYKLSLPLAKPLMASPPQSSSNRLNTNRPRPSSYLLM